MRGAVLTSRLSVTPGVFQLCCLLWRRVHVHYGGFCTVRYGAVEYGFRPAVRCQVSFQDFVSSRLLDVITSLHRCA